MNEITGAALDAAVAAALGREHRVVQLGHNHDNRTEVHIQGLASPWNPATSYSYAMELLVEYDISLLCEDTPNADAKWQAGWTPYTDEFDEVMCKHAAWGPTPSIAICRALVRRAKDQAHSARRDAHNAYWADVIEVANRRAFDAAVARKPHTVFANDDEKVAYIWCMDRAAIRMKIISGEATSAAFEQLAPMPPPFTDTDGSVVYPLSDGREKFVADYDPAFYRDAVMGNPFL